MEPNKPRKPRVKKEPKEPKPARITAEQRKDWRNLPTAAWNTLTFTEYFRGMNEERFGVSVEDYRPFRNWRVEQSLILRELTRYGPEVLRAAFDAAFDEYRPTRDYPTLTGGFAVNYVIHKYIARALADIAERGRMGVEQTRVIKSEPIAW
jgi:hypothetical protein